jgi:hypothetical protein
MLEIRIVVGGFGLWIEKKMKESKSREFMNESEL